MALTGIQIFKLLPKTNCKECGVPTCLAFAMNLASGKAELDSCPYVSEEAREKLAEASAPPIRPVAIGKGVRAFTTGGETVLYRHEKTFYNPAALAAKVASDLPDADLAQKLKTWNAYQFERVGLNLRPEAVALQDVGGDGEAFARKAKMIAETSEFNLILMTEDVAVMKAGIEAAGNKKTADVRGYGSQCGRLRGVGGRKRIAPGGQGRFGRSPGAPDDQAHGDGPQRPGAGLRGAGNQAGSPGPARDPQGRPQTGQPGPGVSDHHLSLRNGGQSGHGDPDRFHVRRQVRRSRRPFGFPRGEHLPPAARAAEHLHRSPAADDRHRGDLRDRQPGRELAGDGHHQFRPDLLHRFGRGRGGAGCPPGS